MRFVFYLCISLGLLAACALAVSNVDEDDNEDNALVVTFPKGSILTSSKGEDTHIRIQVTNSKGTFATPVHVFITKVYPVSNPKQILASNIQARAVSDSADNTLYTAAVFSTRPEQGLYAVDLSVKPLDKNSGFETTTVTRNIKFVAAVEVTDASLRIADSKEQDEADAQSVPTTIPTSEAAIAKANVLQTILFSFRLVSAGRPATAEQVFLKFEDMQTRHEVTFAATLKGKKYTFAIPLKDYVDAFQGHTGFYKVRLVVGDALINNPISWEMTILNIHFGKYQREHVRPRDSNVLPEIVHQFRAPERTPPAQVSLVFTALTLAPLLVFLVGLGVTGANLSKLPWSNVVELFYAVGFQATIGGILSLLVIYWLRLNMMQTLQYLALLGLAAVFFGHRALRYLASLSAKPHTD